MQLRRRLALLVVAAMALAVSGAAAAESTAAPVAPTKRTERVYFHCVGTGKVQNNESGVPSWNTTAPAQSLQSGAGCGHYSNLLTVGGTAMRDATWAGTFTGNLDTMTVELHNVHVSSNRALATMPLSVLLTIDGHTSFTHPAGTPQSAPRIASSTGASDKVLLSFKGLGVMLEEGDGTQVHEISLTIGEYNEQQSAWVWDTTEVPAGITFNPTGTLQGKVIQAEPYPVE
jgi:hypothetical protein